MTRTSRRVQGDDGVALFAAIAVISITSMLALVILGYAVSSARDSAVDRGRSVAVAGVEGAVDSTYARIQTSAPSNLPCTVSPTADGVLSAGPDGAASEATIRYLRADGSSFTDPSGVGCLPAGYDPTQVVGAVITARGATVARDGIRSSDRAMESYVKLTPVFAQANSLGKAIYASGTVAFSNNATILGNGGNDADVYAGTVLSCNNSLSLAGSLYVQGPTTLNNTCSIQGDLHSLGAVTVNEKSTIGGRVISSQGAVKLDQPQITVGGVVQAAGNITGAGTWATCTQPKCQKNLVPPPPPPPSEPFPVLQWDVPTATAWHAAGYTNVVTQDDGCTPATGLNKPSKWFVDNAATLTGKTVLLTNCQIKLEQNDAKDLKLGNDLLIVARGGFLTTNLTRFGSTVTGQQRLLHWVVPFDVKPRPCTTPAITTDNQFNLTDDVRMFLYSPCDIAFANQASHIGQIYGGSNVQINNQFTLQFRPVPVFGVQLPVSTVDVESYKVDIVYKRETG